MSTDLLTFAAQNDAVFGFAGKSGGSIEIVGGSAKAVAGAQSVLSGLKESAYAMGPSIAQAAALGLTAGVVVDPLVGGLVTAGSVINNMLKGSKSNDKGIA